MASKGKSEELLEGDSNTKYFQLATNRKHRKTCIFQLQHDGQIIKDDEALKNTSLLIKKMTSRSVWRNLE
jgi:hypothetical protein